MNVNELSYSEYAERVTRLWLKILRGEEKNFVGFYDLLTADGSDFFFYMSSEMTDIIARPIDFLCYFLLLSVRVNDKMSDMCLDMALETIKDALEEIANEKRE